jgi:hypothetical protein
MPGWVKWAFLATAIGLPIGWAVAAIVDWDHIVDSHTRLGYLVADIALVTQLCFAIWDRLRRARRWAPLVLMFTAGGARLRPRPLWHLPRPGGLHRGRLGLGRPMRRAGRGARPSGGVRETSLLLF